MEETFTTKLVIIFLMKLPEIVRAEMENRGLSIREFAKLVGVSHPTISDILNGEEPSFDVCRKLAPILNLPVEVVLRAAGLLPPVREPDPLASEAAHLVSLLPEDKKQIAVEYIRFLVEMEEKKRRK